MLCVVDTALPLTDRKEFPPFRPGRCWTRLELEQTSGTSNGQNTCSDPFVDRVPVHANFNRQFLWTQCFPIEEKPTGERKREVDLGLGLGLGLGVCSCHGLNVAQRIFCKLFRIIHIHGFVRYVECLVTARTRQGIGIFLVPEHFFHPVHLVVDRRTIARV
jgi:hypothetical protein